MSVDNNDKSESLLTSGDSGDNAASILSGAFSILMVVLLAAGVVVKNVPLESARPLDSRFAKLAPPGQEDVEARLWQDPFDAIEKHRESFGLPSMPAADTLKTLPAPHTPATLHAHIRELRQKDLDSLTVVAVSVAGGAFSEAAEWRRRSRYAVVSALGSLGYNPKNSNTIGYFRIAGHQPDAVGSILTVPYEWYERKEWKGREERKEEKEFKGRSPDVLVLWLNEDGFTVEPLQKLRALFSKLTPPSSKGLNVKLVGITGSEMLKGLIKDSRANEGKLTLESNGGLEVFASGATLSNCDILASLGKPNDLSTHDDPRAWDCFRQDSDYSKRKYLWSSIVRATGTDDVLAAALQWELWQRGVNREPFYEANPLSTGTSDVKTWQRECGDGLVLISELDTEYGRALSRYLTAGFKALCTPNLDESSLVGAFTYFRGLDGTLPGTGKPGVNALLRDGKDDSKDSNTSKGLRAQLEDVPKEHAEGRNQYDYLRRLADEIDRLDRNRKFAEHGVKAIGIVGSDVYDKILILQALRPRFKNKIFFTTDLDARYLHPDQKDWTRNLVVASNFGLTLHQTLQSTTLPFRDSYQAATYLATLMALTTSPENGWQGKLKEWLHPQIFEIGRTEAVYIASPPVAELTRWVESGHFNDNADKTNKTECDSIEELSKCKSIEPNRFVLEDLLDPNFKTVFFGILLVTLVFLASRNFGTKVWDIHLMSSPGHKMAQATTLGLIGVVALIILLIVALPVISWIDALFERRVGEPFRWLEGVSVWPSLILHLTSLCLMVLFTSWSIIQLRSQAISIAKRIRVDIPDEYKLDRSWWARIWPGPHLDLTEYDTNGKKTETKPIVDRQNINAEPFSTSSGRDEYKAEVLNAYSTSEAFDGPIPAAESEGKESAGGTVASMWRNYLRATGWREMILWIAACTTLVSVFFFALLDGSDATPFPHRGELTEKLHMVETLNAFLFWVVVFWVSYEMYLCATLIEMLGTPHNVWPGLLLTREKDQTGIPGEYLVPCLNFELIVEATDRIATLIYLPFISVLFMVLAHSDFLDAMDFPPALVIATVLAIGYVLFTVRLMRKSADAARDKSLEYYEELLLRLANPQSPHLKDILQSISTEQIKLLIKRIHDSHKGIFVHFTQQPGVKAFLLPCGVYGAAQLIEYLINA